VNLSTTVSDAGFRSVFRWHYLLTVGFFLVASKVNREEKMSCQLILSSHISDLKAAKRYLFPSEKEAFVEGMQQD